MATGDGDNSLERFSGILDDLLSLEVNTIIKPGMTATKMPSTGHALIDVVEDYSMKLNEFSEKAERAPVPQEANIAAFEKLRTDASLLARELQGLHSDMPEPWKAVAKPLDSLDGAKLQMLCRIRDNSDQLKAIFKGDERAKFTRTEPMPDLALTKTEKILLRKIWEIGTEEVVMQTVMSPSR